MVKTINYTEGECYQATSAFFNETFTAAYRKELIIQGRDSLNESAVINTDICGTNEKSL